MAKPATSKPLTRRVVLAAGVVAAAGCIGHARRGDRGGGAGNSAGSGGSAGARHPPAWTTVPTITFTLGVPSTFSIASFVADPDGNLRTITHVGVLPNGVTFDSANQRFVYDGYGVARSTENHVLIADDLE